MDSVNRSPKKKKKQYPEIKKYKLLQKNAYELLQENEKSKKDFEKFKKKCFNYKNQNNDLISSTISTIDHKLPAIPQSKPPSLQKMQSETPSRNLFGRLNLDTQFSNFEMPKIR